MSDSLLTIYRGDSVSQDLVLRKNQLPVDLTSVYDIQVTVANDPSESSQTQTFSKLTNEITTVGDPLQGHINLAISPDQTDALLLQEKADLDVVATFRTAQATFTANSVAGNPTLSNVSSFANIAKGKLLTGTGIPSGTLVQNFDAMAQTITMSKNATAPGTGVTVTPTLLSNQTYKVPNGLTVRDRST